MTESNQPAAVHALVIRPDGTMNDIVLAANRVLDDLYAAIDCRSVDLVRLSQTRDMWLDDEGMYAGEVNHAATRLARAHGFVWQPYFGTVVITGGADADGNSVALRPNDAQQIRELLTAK